jgi:hypothetical protein
VKKEQYGVVRGTTFDIPGKHKFYCSGIHQAVSTRPSGKGMQDKDYGKGKYQPRRSHEGPEGEETYSSTLSLISALDMVGA